VVTEQRSYRTRPRTLGRHDLDVQIEGGQQAVELLDFWGPLDLRLAEDGEDLEVVLHR